MPYEPDDILNLSEVADYLRLDPRIVLRVASQLGGRRTGRRWRFRYGDVTEFFHANITQNQRQRVDGESCRGRQAGCLSTVSARKKGRPGMEGRKRMVGGTVKNRVGSKGDGANSDPFGLRNALGLG